MKLRSIIIAVGSLLLSGFLILSIPLINFLIMQESKPRGFVEVAKVSIKKIDLKKKEVKPKKQLKRPERQKPTRTQVKGGPRFAMDLGVMGSGGVSVDVNTLQAGKGGGQASEGVDEEPSQSSDPVPDLPQQVLDAVSNGTTVKAEISFCVDANGRPYDVKIIEESPPGLGLGTAAKMAVQKHQFNPAQKEKKSVAFCGMEQPFEIKPMD